MSGTSQPLRALWRHHRRHRPRVVAAVVDTAGLDEDRVRDWVTVRAMVELLQAAGAPVVDRDRVTLCTTLTKAVQR